MPEKRLLEYPKPFFVEELPALDAGKVPNRIGIGYRMLRIGRNFCSRTYCVSP